MLKRSRKVQLAIKNFGSWAKMKKTSAEKEIVSFTLTDSQLRQYSHSTHWQGPLVDCTLSCVPVPSVCEHAGLTSAPPDLEDTPSTGMFGQQEPEEVPASTTYSSCSLWLVHTLDY